MSMTSAKPNYNFEENFIHVQEILVSNNLGRSVEHNEIVYLDGYFGEIKDFDGIADAADGYINILDTREISTTQIETTDTFVVGGIVFFVSGGSSVAGSLRAGYVADGVAIGVCTKINNGTSVTFRPYNQKAGGIKQTIVEVTASISTQQLVPQIPIGAQILDMRMICRATSSSAYIVTEQKDGTEIAKCAAATAQAVTSASTCAVANKVGTDGLYIKGSAAAVRGILTITWR